MRDLSCYLNDRTVDECALVSFGFKPMHSGYVYQQSILDEQFLVVIELSEQPYAKLIDTAIEEEYVLVDIKASGGDFITKVKQAYEQVIQDMIDTCTKPAQDINHHAEELIEYIRMTYQDEPEYLWEKFPDIAVWRNQKNRKWYAILFIVSQRKLGIESDQPCVVLDVRYPKDTIDTIIDHHTIFEGYHMNKKHWIAIKLDSTIDTETVYQLLEQSYTISQQK